MRSRSTRRDGDLNGRAGQEWLHRDGGSGENHYGRVHPNLKIDFSNFGSLKSTETDPLPPPVDHLADFSNFGSLKSTETSTNVGTIALESDQKLTSRIEPIQEHCDRTKIKKGFA